jgi:hypothetical protein
MCRDAVTVLQDDPYQKLDGLCCQIAVLVGCVTGTCVVMCSCLPAARLYQYIKRFSVMQRVAWKTSANILALSNAIIPQGDEYVSRKPSALTRHKSKVKLYA